MAVLLNQASNLRLRLQLLRRRSDGVRSPASLEVAISVEAYRHGRSLTGEDLTPVEGAFVELVGIRSLGLLDLELMELLERVESLLQHLEERRAGGFDSADEDQGVASLELHGETELGLRISLAGEAVMVECGIDLRQALEPVGELQALPGSDLALFRFAANPRALLAFVAGLIEELRRFPTDPSAIFPGVPS